MKKILLTSLAAVFAVSAAQAVTPYASLKLGYSSVNIKLTDDMTSATLDLDSIYGWTGAIAGGAQFEVSDMIALRGEVEYAYTKFKGKVKSGNPKDSTYTNQTLLLGGYVDFGEKIGLDLTHILACILVMVLVNIIIIIPHSLMLTQMGLHGAHLSVHLMRLMIKYPWI